MDIITLLEKLSWYMPKELQESAINELTLIKDDKLYMLIQPNTKDCWENAAITLNKIGYPRIKKVIPELIRWLRDINWPGATVIIETLLETDRDELLPHIEKALLEAEYDDSWIYGIKLLIDAMKLTKSDLSVNANKKLDWVNMR